MKFEISEEERVAFADFFKQADVSAKGVILPNDAVPFFLKSGLPQETLGLVS